MTHRLIKDAVGKVHKKGGIIHAYEKFPQFT